MHLVHAPVTASLEQLPRRAAVAGRPLSVFAPNVAIDVVTHRRANRQLAAARRVEHLVGFSRRSKRPRFDDAGLLLEVVLVPLRARLEIAGPVREIWTRASSRKISVRCLRFACHTWVSSWERAGPFGMVRLCVSLFPRFTSASSPTPVGRTKGRPSMPPISVRMMSEWARHPGRIARLLPDDVSLADWMASAFSLFGINGGGRGLTSSPRQGRHHHPSTGCVAKRLDGAWGPP